VLRTGGKASDTMFTVYSAGNALPHPRLGITVSRKAAARAVVRNRIKRQIRESFRLHCNRLPPLDIVVIGHRAAAAANPGELRASLAQHWQRLSADA
jgi:ribonuclease P protein component